jgi:hypothetical protein
MATGYHLGMSAGQESSPYEAWLRALRDLTSTAERLAAWRDQRNAFAYRLGNALTDPHPRPSDPRCTAFISRLQAFAMWARPRKPNDGCEISRSARAITWV